MAPAPSASAFPLHPNSCLLDEHDRMLFQHSHPTGTDAERTTLQEGVEGFSAAISKAIQPQSHALHLDQRAGTLPTHHRSNERVPGSSSQATKAAEDQPKYYKELTVRCTRKTSPSVADSMVMAATKPRRLRAPRMVSTFQCPCGVASLIRCPRSALPQSRVICVVTPLSSRKISRSGGIARICSVNSWRRWWFAALSRSCA